MQILQKHRICVLFSGQWTFKIWVSTVKPFPFLLPHSTWYLITPSILHPTQLSAALNMRCYINYLSLIISNFAEIQFIYKGFLIDNREITAKLTSSFILSIKKKYIYIIFHSLHYMNGEGVSIPPKKFNIVIFSNPEMIK